MTRPIYALVLLSGLSLTACAGAERGRPDETMRRFVDLVAASRDDEAWALLSPDAQVAMPRDAFAAMLAEDRADVLERARVLANGPFVERAEVSVEGMGTPLGLILRDDGWRVRSGPILPASTRTPREAASALREALVSGRLSALLALLSHARRYELEAELRDFEEALANEDGLEVVERSDTRATVRLAGGRTLELVMENGEWRLDAWD